MVRCIRSSSLLIVFLVLEGASTAYAGPPDGQPDAFRLYRAAADAIVIESPLASVVRYPDYPPLGPEWGRSAMAAWDHDGTTRKLAHEARSIASAVLPPNGERDGLEPARRVANNLGDAALYQHFQHDDAGAIETLNDLLHLSAVLRRNGPASDVRPPLVAAGIDALIASDLLMITSDVRLAADPADRKSLQVNVAHKLIDDLLHCVPPDDQIKLLGATTQPSATPSAENALNDNVLLRETFARSDAAQIMAATSLACHLYQFEMKRWPQSLAEIVPDYLPTAPTDYWGDGKQTFGYVLIQHGLPDGKDRPLVFCRCGSRDGLFYPVNRPEYTFYTLGARRLQGGQFYDVAAWSPSNETAAQPTTRALPTDTAK